MTVAATVANDCGWLVQAQVARRSGLPIGLVPTVVPGIIGDDGIHRYDTVGAARAEMIGAMLTAGVPWRWVTVVMAESAGWPLAELRRWRDFWRARRRWAGRIEWVRARWFDLAVLMSAAAGTGVALGAWLT